MSTKQLEDSPVDTAQERKSEEPNHSTERDQTASASNEAGVRTETKTPPRDEAEGAAQSSTTEERTDERPKERRVSRTKLVIVAIVAILLLAALLVLGVVPRLRRDKKNDEAAKETGNAVPVVNVVRTERASSDSNLELPGNVEAVQVTTINARTSGYLKRWYVDIGDRVRANQLLAEIDAPETQQEIEQARANLQQARAGLGQTQANLQQARTNAEFARVTYERWHYLVGQGIVSKQDADEKQAAYTAAESTVNARQADVKASQATISANEANIRRLIELQGYQKIYAPFTGVITARFVDTGSLIGASSSASSSSTPSSSSTSGNSGGSTSTSSSSAGNPTPSSPAPSGALFSIARVDTLRIYVNVPQAFVESVRPGQETEVSIRELPQRKFVGRVARTANALDPQTRTLLTEVEVNNSDFTLLPGMYAEVKFGITLPEAPVRVPSSALIVRGDGTFVATLTPEQKIHFQKVAVGRDYGKAVDIVSGLDEGQSLVIDPTVSLQEGTQVKANEAKNNNQQPGQGQNPQGSNNQGPNQQSNGPQGQPGNNGTGNGTGSGGSGGSGGG